EAARRAGVPLLTGTSLKAALDVDWDDPAQKKEALNRLLRQMKSLQEFLERELRQDLKEPPLTRVSPFFGQKVDGPRGLCSMGLPTHHTQEPRGPSPSSHIARRDGSVSDQPDSAWVREAGRAVHRLGAHGGPARDHRDAGRDRRRRPSSPRSVPSLLLARHLEPGLLRALALSPREAAA